MRDRWIETAEDAVVSDVQEVVIESVEVYEPRPEPEVTPGDLIALLVAHFEESLINKEHELIALRRSVEDTDREAAEVQFALRQELDTANQIVRILERENQRLLAEVEGLRQQTAASQTLDENSRLVQILERENQRLLAECDALRQRIHMASSGQEDETLLEELLEREVGAAPPVPQPKPSPARRFRMRSVGT